MTRKPAQKIRLQKRATTRLSSGLDKRLLAYASAASAAGVALLALAQTAEARIVYTASNTHIEEDVPLNLDVNNDGIADFNIVWGFEGGVRHPEGDFASALLIYPGQAGNEVWGIHSAKGWECAAALPGAVNVGPGAAFQAQYLPLWQASGSYTRGGTEHCPWASKHRGAFLGLKFVIGGQIHYGWAHITVSDGLAGTMLNGYAYETVVNQPILTGKANGPVEKASSSISLPLGAAQPATLGLLARGERGLAIWRKSDEQEAASL
jgi:hypothetical protein